MVVPTKKTVFIDFKFLQPPRHEKPAPAGASARTVPAGDTIFHSKQLAFVKDI